MPMNEKRISQRASDLNYQTNIILGFDYAPDGIKRYVEINRKHGDDYLKSNIARIIECREEDISKDIQLKVDEIDMLVNEELLKKNIFYFNNLEKQLVGYYYVSNRPIGTIFPETLLTQILGTGSKLDLLYKNNAYQDHPVFSEEMANTAACASYGDKDFQEARKEIESRKYISISLDDNSRKVLCIPERASDTRVKTIKEYVSESISAFQPMAVIREYGKQDVELDWRSNAYSDYLSKIANNRTQSLVYRVSRQKVAEVLSTLFGKISDLHKKGLVHCDLKPQNILCLDGGLMPFDGINAKRGEISAGMTMNYCAPEQILTMPISPATDIYNLGLMILSVIDGILYGKTSAYVIPIGGVNVKEVKLLSEPRVYLDYETANIENKEGIVFWKSFLEKCLAFESRNRFPNIESFAYEYNRLLELYPLKNEIEFSPNFGKLSLVRFNGKFEAAWLINVE